MADSPWRRRLSAPSGGPRRPEAADERGRDGGRGGARLADLAPRVRVHRPSLASGDALLLFRRARHAFGLLRLLVVAAGLVALHHLTLDLVLPNAVYPGASDLKRVAVHAVVVVIETAMLIFIGRAIIAAFEAARQNGTDAERLAGDLHRLVAERERDLSDTVSQANAVGAAVDRFQAEIGDAVRLLQDAATALRGNADELGAVAVQAEQRTTAAAQASGQTSQTVSAVAAAGGELAETIAAIGASASQSSELASRAVGQAEAANQTVADLGRLGNEIGDVIASSPGSRRRPISSP